MVVLVGNVWMDGRAAGHLVAGFSGSSAPAPCAVDSVGVANGFLSCRSGKRAIGQTRMA